MAHNGCVSSVRDAWAPLMPKTRPSGDKGSSRNLFSPPRDEAHRFRPRTRLTPRLCSFSTAVLNAARTRIVAMPRFKPRSNRSTTAASARAPVSTLGGSPTSGEPAGSHPGAWPGSSHPRSHRRWASAWSMRYQCRLPRAPSTPSARAPSCASSTYTLAQKVQAAHVSQRLYVESCNVTIHS